MNEPESYFYHSFPRRYREDPAAEIDSGLKILSSIISSGFLLSPEITEWKERRDDGSLGERWENIQKTCSFTDLSPNKLSEHSKRFGRFSVEFDSQSFRELGGIPVFYLPRASEEDRGLESLAASLVARTGEIQTLLNRLAEVETDLPANVNKNRNVAYNKNGQQVCTRCSYEGAQDLIDFLTDGTQPVYILRNALRVLAGFMYPTENLKYTGMLAYYRQREWRLIANMSHNGQDIDRDLTDPEKDKLVAIDNEFFGKEIKYRTGTYRRVDQCRIFSMLDGKPVIQYAKRVIVPSEAVTRAVKLLEGYAEVPIVALEELVDN